MPSRNRIKNYSPDAYYHIYNRGVDKQPIFHFVDDYRMFLGLFKRYLDAEPAKDSQGRQYTWLHNDLQLLSFCLMPNHFHLLVHQSNADAMTRLLRGVCTAYTMYFNKKYNRVGPLFQERFKASMITSDSYLQHISRYIHLNPSKYKEWEFSSLPYYLGSHHAAWINPQPILDLFEGSPQHYLKFVEDYEDYHAMLKAVEKQLADH